MKPSYVMERVFRLIWVFALTILSITPVSAQNQDNKSQSYYSTHESEILPDAQIAFREGNYELAAKLCEWHFIMIGNDRAKKLREKALKCAKLIIEMNALSSYGQQKAAQDKANAILELNPDDKRAQAVNSIPLTDVTYSGSTRTIYSKEATIKVGEVIYAKLSEGSVETWELNSNSSQFLHSNPDGSITAIKSGSTSVWGYINSSPKLFKLTIVGSDSLLPQDRAPYLITSKVFTMYVGDHIKARLSIGEVSKWEIEDYKKEYISVDGNVLSAKKVGTCSVWGYINEVPILFKITIKKH